MTAKRFIRKNYPELFNWLYLDKKMYSFIADAMEQYANQVNQDKWISVDKNDDTYQMLLENIADFLDSDSVTIKQLINKVKDPINR